MSVYGLSCETMQSITSMVPLTDSHPNGVAFVYPRRVFPPFNAGSVLWLLVIFSALHRSTRYRPDVFLFSSLAAYLDRLEWCSQQSRMIAESSLLRSSTPARRGWAGSRSGE